MHQPHRLSLLNEIGRVVSSALDLQTLYDTIYYQIGRVMDTTEFFIALDDPQRNTVNLPYHQERGKLLKGQTTDRNSVTGLVVKRGIPLLFNTDEEYTLFAATNGLPVLTVGEALSEAKIWVPLSTGLQTIGALSVQSAFPHAYSPDDLQMLSVIASQAAIAIVNAELYEQSQKNVRRMQALLNVARTVNSSLDLQSVLDAVLTGIRTVSPYFIAEVALPRSDDRTLRVARSLGPDGPNDRRRDTVVPLGEGTAGKAFGTGAPIMAPRIDRYHGYTPGDPRVRSELAVPLKRGERVIGVLTVQRTEEAGFTEEDVNLLTLFAAQAAIAIENARLFAEEQERIDELSTIQSIVQKLTPLHDIPTIAGVIARELTRLIDYHALRLFVVEDHTLVPLVSTGADISMLQVRIGEGIAGWIAAHGSSVLVGNTLDDPRVTQIPGTPRREESMIGAPLIYEGRVQGVITLTKLGIDQFDANDQRLLAIIAGQAAIVFDRARLYAELVKDAMTDPLTGLFNRRYLKERLKEERSRAMRTGQGLAAIMLDIDRFKRVNDRFGHDAGDVVLRELAGVIARVVRVEDIVARYGGEEFCVLVPEIPEADAEGVAERVRAAVAGHRLPPAAGVDAVSVSVGIAHLAPEDDEDSLFSRADQAMYAGKRLGGNMVWVTGSDGVSRQRIVA
jgi:diguanylate cyclase (GGDEF)-like protein